MKGERELMRRPIPDCPQTDIQPTYMYRYERWDGTYFEEQRYNYIYTAIKENDLLTITVYAAGGGMEFRTFLRGEEYISQVKDSESPRTSRIIGLVAAIKAANYKNTVIPVDGADLIIQEWLAQTDPRTIYKDTDALWEIE